MRWIAFPIALAAMAADWPRFRGPNGAGVAAGDAQLPTEFGPGRHMRWRTPVPFGRSSPVIASGAVYLTAAEEGALVTMRLDTGTGAIGWRRTLAPLRKHEIFQSNDPASPTPVTDGANVYSFFADFGLISYTADGKERWRLPLGPFENFYGMAGSPILSGSTLLMLCDQRQDSFLLAVDKDTGRVRWRVRRDYVKLEAYSTPVLRDEKEVIVYGSSRVDAYSIATGERLWFARAQGYNAKGTPVLYRDLLIASSPGSDEPIYPAFAALDLNGDGKLTVAEFDKNEDLRGHFPTVDSNHDGLASPDEWAFTRNLGVGDYGMCGIRMGGSGDVTATHIVWRNKRNYPNVPSPLIYRDVLYAVKNGGVVSSYDPLTGEVKHSARAGPGALGDYYASPVAGDGKLYLVNKAGKVSVLEAGATFRTLAVNDLQEEVYATPALVDGRIYLRTAKALYAFGLQPN